MIMTTPSQLTMARRDFLKTAGAGLASLTTIRVLPALAQNSPNERIRHAVIGAGGQGKSHCKSFSQIQNCEVAAVCDVDPERLEATAALLPNSGSVRKFADFRRLLEDRTIDTVSIATCDH